MLRAVYYKLRELRGDERGGTALMLVVLILAGALFVSLSISDIVRNGLVMSRDRVYSTKAFFAAEAGAERVLYEIRKGGFFDSNICGSDYDFCFDDYDSASYSAGFIDGDLVSCLLGGCTPGLIDIYNLPNNSSYSIRYIDGAGKTKIKCTGYYENISRIVELTY